MAAELFTPPSRALDGNASPYSGAQWFFYASGTTTPQAVFADADLATPSGSVVTADSGGKFPDIYFDASLAYRAICKNADGSVTLHDSDPVNFIGFVGLSEPGGAELIGWAQSGSSPQSRNIGDKLRENVSVDDYTTKQASITEIVNQDGGVMDVVGATTLPASLMIDRLVDTTTKDMWLRGTGRKAALLVTTAIDLLDSTITVTADPKTEALRVSDMTVGASSAALNAHLLSKKFLRTNIDNVRFEKLKLFDSPIYRQSDYIHGVTAWRWSGTWAKTAGTLYDWRLSHSRFESGGAGVEALAVLGGSFIGNLFEGSSGSFLKFAGANGLAIIGNYTESNLAQDYPVNDIAGGGVSKGFLFGGNCILSPVAGPAVAIGVTTGVGLGNYTPGDLYDLTNTKLGHFTDIGSHADGAKFNKDGFWSGHAVGVLPKANAVAAAGTNQATATKLKAVLNRVTSVAANTGVSLLGSGIVWAEFGMFQIVTHDDFANAGVQLKVYYDPGDTTNFGSPSTVIASIPFGMSARFEWAKPGYVEVYRSIAAPVSVTDPTGGGTVDSQSRTAIAAINAILKANGLAA